MKKILVLSSCFSIFLLLACEKDEPTLPVPPHDPGTEEPEDTVVLQPFWFVRDEIYFGYAQAVWQDSFLWDASGSASHQDYHTTHPDDYLDMRFQTFEPAGVPNLYFKRQKLLLSEIPLSQIGTYIISGGTWDLNDGMVGARFFTSTDDGDVAEDSYIVDETATDNVLTVTEVDIEEQVYKGTFTVSFEISTEGGKRNPNNPDKLKIKDGEFMVKIF